MRRFNSGRIRRLAAVVGAGLVVLLMVAGAASAMNGSEPASIAEVRVERDGDATVVTLMGLEDPIFTAFKQQNPERVVVEIASARFEELMDPMA